MKCAVCGREFVESRIVEGCVPYHDSLTGVYYRSVSWCTHFICPRCGHDNRPIVHMRGD